VETEDIDTDAGCLKHSINGIVLDWLMRDLKKAQDSLKDHPLTHTHFYTCQADKHTNKHVIIIMPKGDLVVASQDIVSHTAGGFGHSWRVRRWFLGGRGIVVGYRMRHSHSAPVKHAKWRQFVCA